MKTFFHLHLQIEKQEIKQKNLGTISSVDLLTSLFFRCVNPVTFSVYFQSFQSNGTIFTTNQCEKCPLSIQRRVSNSQPLDYEYPLQDFLHLRWLVR